MTGKYVERFAVMVGDKEYFEWEQQENANWSAEGLSQFYNDVRVVPKLVWVPKLDLSSDDETPV